MAWHLVSEVAKDGNSVVITGGIVQNDTSGTGAGPNAPVVTLSDNTGAEVVGTTADAAYAGSGNSSLVAALKGIFAKLAGTLTATLAAGANVIGAVTQSGSWAMKLTDGTNAETTFTPYGTAPSGDVLGANVFVTNALAPGRNTPANSSPVVMASQDYQFFPASTASTAIIGQSGTTGAAGDWLDFIEIIPLTTSPGQVTLQDGTDTAQVIFEGGAISIASLVPFTIPIKAVSKTGAWKIVTGANETVMAAGNFH